MWEQPSVPAGKQQEEEAAAVEAGTQVNYDQGSKGAINSLCCCKLCINATQRTTRSTTRQAQ